MSNIIAPRIKGYWDSEYGRSIFSDDYVEEEYVPCEYCDMLWQDFASNALSCIEWHDMDVLFGMHLLDACEEG